MMQYRNKYKIYEYDSRAEFPFEVYIFYGPRWIGFWEKLWAFRNYADAIEYIEKRETPETPIKLLKVYEI